MRADAPVGDVPTHLERAQALHDQRRARTEVFDGDHGLLHGVAWDIIVDLFIADEAGYDVIADADNLTDVSPTVGKRWLAALEQQGLVECRRGAQGWLVGLTERANAMMRSYLDRV